MPKEFDFETELDAVFKAHDQRELKSRELTRKASEADREKLDAFRTFKSSTIKPLLQRTVARLAERGHKCGVSEQEDPPKITLTVDTQTLIAFSLQRLNTLQITIGGKPLGAGELKSRFGWEDDPMDASAVSQAITGFVADFLARQLRN